MPTPAQFAPSTSNAMTSSTIMMIDDEPLTLDTLQIFLEEAGYEQFVLTTDPRDAFAALEREHPDIVLLDLVMPHVNGFEILQYIRDSERFKFLPVVVLTSSSEADTKLKALELGATDFLAKPVDESELILRVRNTLAAKAYQDRLTYFDRLTGLPNRQMLIDRIDWALRQARRYNQSGALLHIDILRFRQLNEALGPSLADDLLRQIGHRLEAATRESDYLTLISENEGTSGLARLGGDEFALLLHGRLSPETVGHVARRLLGAMNAPFRIGAQELFVSIHIGIATFPEEGTNTDTLQRNAGIAVRSIEASETDPNRLFRFYSPELNARTIELLNLEADLRHALDRNQLELAFQPKYRVSDQTPIGAECLVRWKHPERGYIPPVEFIPVAEETGLIVEIGQFIVREACQSIADWQKSGIDPGVLAINASVQQFRIPDAFFGVISDALKATEVAPKQIKIEVTESILMTQPDTTVALLNQLQALGVKLSIDDFGTGYSSLSYLRTLPVDELKIDRSFLVDVESSGDSASIVKAIIALAHSLDLEVVAEGVETHEQLNFLREHDCNTCQGYLLSHPLSREDYGDFMRATAHASPTLPQREATSV